MARTMRRRRLLITGSALTVALAAAAWFLTPPLSPPSYRGERPELQEDGYVSRTHSVFVDATPAAVHAWVNDPAITLEDLVDFDEGEPAVIGTTPLAGSEETGQRAGFRRRVEFEDGHYLAEEMLVDTEERFQYMVWGFTRPAQRIAVRHGVAEFTYLPEGDGTRVNWTYSLLPTAGVLRSSVESFLDSTMDPMMTATLEGIRQGVESESAS
ncbi:MULTISPECIES: SRPBCC family protein [Actinoalloteichus]|uniref:Polyketide cyclase n=1 Tax=Actinoalloteichus fjordicus TaxID=1612552 RepID=A0AAC9L850_9PSEU|nr:MULTISPECIES: SRPBCC family protein [Actinoalloteichus]APU13158.1 hypothetical protein UA74_05410 [Actinoalloteichus fjordicus]APU19108.1 hypothetical protein UA75_05410 [Actinoalloteichus sp. GBA129-24]